MEGPAERAVGVLTPEWVGDPWFDPDRLPVDAVHPDAAIVPGVPGLLSVVAWASPPICSRSMRFYSQQQAASCERSPLAQLQLEVCPVVAAWLAPLQHFTCGQQLGKQYTRGSGAEACRVHAGRWRCVELTCADIARCCVTLGLAVGGDFGWNCCTPALMVHVLSSPASTSPANRLFPYILVPTARVSPGHVYGAGSQRPGKPCRANHVPGVVAVKSMRFRLAAEAGRPEVVSADMLLVSAGVYGPLISNP
jgi:hypothetical protein